MRRKSGRWNVAVTGLAAAALTLLTVGSAGAAGGGVDHTQGGTITCCSK
ncbi:MAG TPA: hypothetical protein VFX33_05495 [Actinomycetales bacterium]|nr:hypothetical protein [Actinomycetales bacterium]